MEVHTWSYNKKKNGIKILKISYLRFSSHEHRAIGCAIPALHPRASKWVTGRRFLVYGNPRGTILLPVIRKYFPL